MKNILLEETLPGSYGYYAECTYYRKNDVEKTSDGYTIGDWITVPSLGKYLMEKGESPAPSKVILGESVVITVEEQGQQMTFTGNTFTLATPLPTYGSLTGYYVEAEAGPEGEKIGLFATGATTNPEILDQAIFRWFSVEEVPYERQEVAVNKGNRRQEDVYNTWGEGYYRINDNSIPIPTLKAIIEHTGVKRNVRINSQYGPLLEGEIVSSVKWEDSSGHISEVSGNLIMAYYDSQNVWYFGNVVGEGEVMLVQDQVYYLTPFLETLYTDIKPGVTYYKDEKLVAYNQSVKPLAFEIAEDETRTLTWEEAGMTDEILQTYWDMYRSRTYCGKDYGLTINGKYPPKRSLYGEIRGGLKFVLPRGKADFTVTIIEENRTVLLKYESEKA